MESMNKTGVAVNPEGVRAMQDAVQRFSPPTAIDTVAADLVRQRYVRESEAIGSIPKPLSLGGVLKSGIARLRGQHPELLMDKMGERIAFERGGVRLYDALIAKHQAADACGEGLPPIALALHRIYEAPDLLASLRGEQPEQTLMRIRAQELAHFHLLCDAMQQLGGDPSAQTPCADVVGVASAGLIQVVTDPRTTFAQSLNAMLTAELTDNAGWELLIQLAAQADQTELCDAFEEALTQEAQHLVIIRSWLAALLLAEDKFAAT